MMSLKKGNFKQLLSCISLSKSNLSGCISSVIVCTRYTYIKYKNENERAAENAVQ